MIKRENFINIQGWMVTDLKLKGNELLIYAIIYGFSQDENSKFTGSLTYLSEWTNSTKQGVLKALKSLITKNLIVKNEIVKNKVKLCEYSVTPLNKIEHGIKQSLTGCSTKFNGGIKQSLPNSINNKIEDTIENKNNIYSSDFNDFYNLYPRKQSKHNALRAYIRARKNKIDKNTIIEGLKRYIEYIKTYKKEKEFIKLPATWLNQGCWDDEYDDKEYSANDTDVSKLINMIKEV